MKTKFDTRPMTAKAIISVAMISISIFLIYVKLSINTHIIQWFEPFVNSFCYLFSLFDDINTYTSKRETFDRIEETLNVWNTIRSYINAGFHHLRWIYEDESRPA